MCRASFECVRMMTRMFVPCMLVCSAAGALVVAAGCRCNTRMHFVTAVFARGTKKCALYYIFVSCRPTGVTGRTTIDSPFVCADAL